MIEQIEQEEMKIIVFQLKDKEYALPVNHVKAIEKIIHITRVPKTVPFIKGVINLRGVIIPIIDLRIRFAIDDQVYTEQTRIIIVTLDEMDVGLIVDSANDVIDIFMENIEPQPDVVGSIADEFISGVVKLDKRLLILLNLEKVLNPEETLLSVKEG
ncbi:chemotaxis protein CheW [Peribacillus psychrosaccharolyticus]|uniref:Chemotaxis protein CheW n=1 Tax=Peribacillus psychrosaccharolyticus TaxID=1407 RepID=A0A974S2M3_PERPY|nr:chemotaxis protein CheW [Peribacillus psychrosaccharolyticus]MEC2053826.1 chemotaxis protein CheW [Peribacillus psychrosaccharolyticus]MED3742560.1 chemotaxis protein CheW [Peribacillus psychrosaccharolyticus]QQT01510.1 chemotaxis protein CheW [Peribacillus psychrosaccharolyticus]